MKGSEMGEIIESGPNVIIRGLIRERREEKTCDSKTGVGVSA